MEPVRTLFGRSLVARRPLPAGHIIAAGDLTAKKPGGGIPPARIDALVGMRLRRALSPDEPVADKYIEPVP